MLLLHAVRTRLSVFARTALQSLVSSSGMSRLHVGSVKGEQPAIREEGVGPLPVVGFASSDAGALVLLAQDGAQPSADEAIDDAKQSRCGMLEVAKPSPQHRVEVTDDPFQGVAAAADRLAPHFVLERLQALLAHQPATRLNPVAGQSGHLY